MTQCAMVMTPWTGVKSRPNPGNILLQATWENSYRILAQYRLLSWSMEQKICPYTQG